MGLDIHTFVRTAFYLGLFGLVIFILFGVRSIRSGLRLQFYRKRQELIVRGWQMIFLAALSGGLAFLMNSYAEPAIYFIYPPSPTVTRTPTITITPTVTLTGTITPTQTITNTPSITSTPFLPTEVFAKILSTTTPNPASVFSDIVFAREIDKDNQPVDPGTEFANPILSLYGTYSYDKMTVGSQWSALWYFQPGPDEKLICYESNPWDGSTGGYGYTNCNLSSDLWQPGEYEVRIFVGIDWKSSGRFTVTGAPPTAKPTASPTRTIGPTPPSHRVPRLPLRCPPGHTGLR